MRLAKFLASAGVASRRAAEEIVRAGRVRIDGARVTDPARDVLPDENEVTVDEHKVVLETDRVVYLVHKPTGVVSTASDPQGRPTVVSLVPGQRRLYPVGRLDIDASGLILLTDDGPLAYRLTHPSFEVDKTYRVRVGNAPVAQRALQRLRAGVDLEDGRTSPARVTRIKPDQLEITIHEGRKRQVKRMCEAVGHPAITLQRVRFGPLQLRDLKPGAYRRLTDTETDLLRNAGRAGRRGEARSSAGSATPRRRSGSTAGRPPSSGP